MATNISGFPRGYSLTPGGLQNIPPFVINTSRAPATSDRANLGTLWNYININSVWMLTSATNGNYNWTPLTNNIGVISRLQAADGTIALPVAGTVVFPNTVITANTNEFTNILTSAQANNSNNFLVNLTPEVKLRSTLNDVVTVKSVTNNNTATQINIFKSKGTIAVPLPVVATTELSDISSYGFDGTNNTIGTSIKSRVPAGGVIGANCVESELAFSTAGSTAGIPPSILNERVIIGKDGLVRINTPTEAGSALTINGVNTNANYTLQSTATVNADLHNAARFVNTNATAGSGCQVSIDVDNQPLATGGDPTLRFLNTGIRAIAIGIDTSTNEFVMANSSTLGLNNFFTLNTANNQINLPQQCSFHAFHAIAQNNVTGAGGAPIVTFTTVRHNVGNFFKTGTSRFEPPVFGRYLLTAQVQCDDVGTFVGMTVGYIQLYVNGVATVLGQLCSPVATAAAGVEVTFALTTILELSPPDFVEIGVVILNGAGNTVDLLPTTTSYFAGQLLS